MSERKTNVSRRGFLKTAATGLVVGAAASAPEAARGFSLVPEQDGLPPEREIPTFCELCFWNCGAVARVRRNRVLSLRGHPDYPTARGKLCGRGNAGAGSVVDEDRLKHPMIRTGARGEGKFRRAGWKEAYARIAEGFGRIKKEHGAQALALFYHGSGGPLIRTAMVAYGSPNYAGPSYAQCKGSRNVGYALTFGEKLGSPEPIDLEETRCMVFFGSHLGENAHNSQMQEFVKARARGASLVVLDPRFSTVAQKADVWLPVRPGSDLAVLLAWLHLLVKEGTYDRRFVAERTVGFEQLAAHVAPFTPAWAAAQADVPAERIVEAYRLMVKAMPAVVVHPGRHTAWYGEADTQRARGQAILTALLGAWWKPGGIYRAERGRAQDYPTPDFPELAKNVDQAAGRFPFEHEVTTNGIREATLTGKPYPVKGWFVHGTNLIEGVERAAPVEQPEARGGRLRRRPVHGARIEALRRAAPARRGVAPRHAPGGASRRSSATRSGWATSSRSPPSRSTWRRASRARARASRSSGATASSSRSARRRSTSPTASPTSSTRPRRRSSCTRARWRRRASMRSPCTGRRRSRPPRASGCSTGAARSTPSAARRTTRSWQTWRARTSSG